MKRKQKRKTERLCRLYSACNRLANNSHGGLQNDLKSTIMRGLYFYNILFAIKEAKARFGD